MNALDKLVLKIVSIKNSGDGGDYRLPIKEICGVRIEYAEIHIPRGNSSERILFRINAEYLPCDIYGDWFPFTKASAKDTMKNIIELINNFKFDKSISRLVDKRKELSKEIITPQNFYDLFGCENIKLDYDECCVCSELTNSYFRECKHTICYECCSKLPIKNDCVSCPICRNEACVCSCESDLSDTLLDTY